MIQTLLALAVGVAVLGVISVARRVFGRRVPDILPPDVLMRINHDYSELPQ